ncbi:MAG TPA: FKBP-type peptidyl-prolyl cis-trans isomerase [Candidatus Didemnitutus sp.]|nr:FKBP-type peptidyl-prolyl cis-trans isomerase [Candidatus Didemnitutus sp.]
MSPLFRRLSFALLVSVTLVTAPVVKAQRERLPPEDLEIVEKRWPNAKRTSTSLRYIVLKEGDTKGGMPEPGMMVAVNFKGMLLDGTVFDEALDPKNPLKIRIGRENLIAGWEQALLRMHKGDKFLLIVPYELGYGTRGRPPSIPSRATLVFEMELQNFSPEMP